MAALQETKHHQKSQENHNLCERVRTWADENVKTYSENGYEYRQTNVDEHRRMEVGHRTHGTYTYIQSIIERDT
ncbi:hypothetical protein QF041_003497 [Paenibacillus sp. W2I17]|nr:hypothetical protein [Paenibacillus sp. W2I17]